MTGHIDLIRQRPFATRTRRYDAFDDFAVKRDGEVIGNALYWARGWCFIRVGHKRAFPTQFYPTPFALREALRSGEVVLPPIEEPRLSFSEGTGRQERCINVSYLSRKLGRIEPEHAGWRFYCFKRREHGESFPCPDSAKTALEESRVWER